MKTLLLILLTAVLGALAAPAQQLRRRDTKEYDIVMVPDSDIAAVFALLGLTPEMEDIFATYDNTHFQGFSGALTAGEYTLLSAMPHVMAIAEVIEGNVEETRGNAPWGLQRISQQDTITTWNSATSRSFEYAYDDDDAVSLGAGVDVYVLDTGIYTTHFEFGRRARMGYTYFADSATDRHGHGTHCAGTIGGATVGVASGANLIGVKVLSDAGPGPSTALLAGLDYVAGQHDARARGPNFVGSVMSLSLGFKGRSEAVETAIARLVQGGVHAAIAAGNAAGNACAATPAVLGGAANSSALPVTVVGAHDVRDRVADFSNTGPCVDVYAPGAAVVSAAVTDGPGGYKVMSGTSMAAPHVAGLMAYYLAIENNRARRSGGAARSSPAEVKAWVVEHAVRGVLQGGGGGDEAVVANNGAVGGGAGAGEGPACSGLFC